MRYLLRSEELVLLGVWHLQDNAYGVTIRRHLEQTTGKTFSFAAVYEPLDRLTQQGFLAESHGAPTNERGGRRRRLFRLTPLGEAALAEIQRINKIVWKGVPQFEAAS